MKSGAPMIDSTTRFPTKFLYAGDPITQTGSVCPARVSGGGSGFMMNTGPCSIAPGDSQWVMMALIPSVKLNGIDAINRMRASATYLRSLPYDSLIIAKPRRSTPQNPHPDFHLPSSLTLSPNYPNPFNAGTNIQFYVPENSIVHIEAFDVLGRSVGVLADGLFNSGTRRVKWAPELPSGVYLISVQALSTKSATTWNATQKIVILK